MRRRPQQRPGRPNITPVHQTFYEKVIVAAQHMTEVFVERATAGAPEPPPDEVLEFMRERATAGVSFWAPGQPWYHSRAFAGSIAGSDFFTFNQVNLPAESDRDVDPTFPGRVITLTLLYGDPNVKDTQAWEARLYSGHGTPPVFVDERAAWRFLAKTRQTDTALSDLTLLQDNLPERLFHYPDADELTAVLGGLAVVHEDLDHKELFTSTLEHFEGDQADPSWLAWLRAQRRRL